MSVEYIFDMHTALEAGGKLTTTADKCTVSSYNNTRPEKEEVFITHWFWYENVVVRCEWFDKTGEGEFPLLSCITSMGSKHRKTLPEWLTNNNINWSEA